MAELIDCDDDGADDGDNDRDPGERLHYRPHLRRFISSRQAHRLTRGEEKISDEREASIDRGKEVVDGGEIGSAQHPDLASAQPQEANHRV